MTWIAHTSYRMGKKVEIQLDERLMDVVGGLEGESLDGKKVGKMNLVRSKK